MEKLTQQNRHYANPHFGQRKRALLAKLFETVKTALTPEENRPFLQEFNATHLESYTIFRNGVHYETFVANECACRVEIIALQKLHPHDDWTFLSNQDIQSEGPATVAA